MFENNKFFDYPAQVSYKFIGDNDEFKAIAYGEVLIDLASGEVIYIDDEIDIIHISSSWSPYFID